MVDCATGGVVYALKLENQTHLGSIDSRVAEVDKRLMAECKTTRSFFMEISEFGSRLTKTLSREEAVGDEHANAIFVGGAGPVCIGVKTWTPEDMVVARAATVAMAATVARVATAAAAVPPVADTTTSTTTAPTTTLLRDDDFHTLAKRFKEDEERYKRTIDGCMRTIDGYMERELEFKHKTKLSVKMEAQYRVLEAKLLTRDGMLASANNEVRELQKDLEKTRWKLAAEGDEDAVAQLRESMAVEYGQEVAKLQAELAKERNANHDLTEAKQRLGTAVGNY
jgi:uncharacterized protein YgiM (DUF1202 family)